MNGCGMHTKRVWSLNYDITTSLGLGLSSIFLKSTPDLHRRNCRSLVSWPWTDHFQISLIHSPTPPKCSMRAIVALINNLGIVYHQYCSSSYLDYPAAPGSSYRSRQWKSSSNLIPTRPPELLSQSRLPTDSDECPKAPSTFNSPLSTLSL